MRTIYIILILLLVAGCTPPAQVPENKTYFFGGEPVTFNFRQTNITTNESIVIESANYTGEIYVYSFCNHPFNMLVRQGNTWKYVFPDYLECSEPNSTTLEFNKEYPIGDIPSNTGIVPGTYLVKIYYSTYAPEEYLRESNTIIDVHSTGLSS